MGKPTPRIRAGATHGITSEQWEFFWLCDNQVAVCDVHQDHAPRVAEILSHGNPGVLFFWSKPGHNRAVTIHAVRPDKRRLGSKREASITAAAEAIARNVANKRPVRWYHALFRGTLHRGWHFTEAKDAG